MNYKSIFGLFFLPFIVILIDLLFRLRIFEFYNNKHIAFYIFSCLISMGIFIFWLLLLKRLINKPPFYYLASALFVIFFLFILAMSWGYKWLNDLYPNYYTLLYFKTEPQSAFKIIKDVIGWKETLMAIILVAISTYSLKFFVVKFIPDVSIKRISMFGLFTFLIFEILVSYHRKYDQCAIVDVNFFANLQRHAFTWDDHSTFKGQGLGVRRLTYPKVKPSEAPFNVLVIICESFRKKSLHIYGNEHQTTPKLDAFAKKHEANFYTFERPYTVSTTTMLAVPATLSGIGPYQDSSILYTQPLIWDYATHFNYERFFISSHTLKWYKFSDFYKNDRLDTWWNKDNSKLPYYNDLGVKDEATIAKTIQTIQKINQKPFFGTIQLNTTHNPYRVPKKYEKWNKTYRDSYDNAVLYQDDILGQLLNHLEATKTLSRTIIIITSDHGESLMEHRNIGHVESNYLETISIPLMMFIPQGILNEKEQHAISANLKKTTSNIDIAPTLMDLLGLDENINWQIFKNRLTGFSLLKNINPNRQVISLNNNQVASFNTGFSFVNNRFHYLLRTNVQPHRKEWYDLKKDPNELHNQGKNIPKAIQKLISSEIQKYPLCHKFKVQ